MVHPTDRKWVNQPWWFQWDKWGQCPLITGVNLPTYDSWDEPPSINQSTNGHLGHQWMGPPVLKPKEQPSLNSETDSVHGINFGPNLGMATVNGNWHVTWYNFSLESKLNKLELYIYIYKYIHIYIYTCKYIYIYIPLFKWTASHMNWWNCTPSRSELIPLNPMKSYQNHHDLPQKFQVKSPLNPIQSRHHNWIIRKIRHSNPMKFSKKKKKHHDT